MSKEFGEYLRELRRKNALTQKQVADELHIDRSTYAYYERGTTEPSLVTVRKLANVFNVSVEELLPQTDNRSFAKVSDVKKGLDTDKGDDEEVLLSLYRELTVQQKEMLRNFVLKIKGEE